MMSKGMIAYIIAFAGLILASLAFANADQITPNIAQSQGELTVGVNTFTMIEKVLSLGLNLLIGTVISSVVGVVLMAGWKRYQRWDRDERARRWNPGPNARWQQPGATRTPSLKREDLMLLAMLNGRMPSNTAVSSRLSANRAAVQDEQPIDLDF